MNYHGKFLLSFAGATALFAATIAACLAQPATPASTTTTTTAPSATTTQTTTTAPATSSATTTTQTTTTTASNQTDLSKFNFTVGVGSFMLKKGDRDVRTATADNGTIRVTEERRYLLGFWLTSTLPFNTSWLGIQPGAFVGVQLNGDDRLLSSYAFGFSFASSLKNPNSPPLIFQVGYGFTQIQRLADGYVDGHPLPAGANQPLLKKETVGAAVMMVSTRF